MAKNKIQFQQGISLPEFLATYGTDEQCRRRPVSMALAKRFHLPRVWPFWLLRTKHRALFQERAARHLSCNQQQTFSPLSCRVLLSIQQAL